MNQNADINWKNYFVIWIVELKEICTCITCVYEWNQWTNDKNKITFKFIELIVKKIGILFYKTKICS